MQRRAVTRRSAVRVDRPVKLLTFAVLTVCAILLAVTAIRLMISQNTLAGQRGEISQLQACVDNLSGCIEQYHNLTAIKQRAEQIGMRIVYEDEVQYVYVNAPQPQTVQSVSAEAPNS